MIQKRMLTITYDSHLTDQQWAQMAAGIMVEVEQWACFYAASCPIDDYELKFFLAKEVE